MYIYGMGGVREAYQYEDLVPRLQGKLCPKTIDPIHNHDSSSNDLLVFSETAEYGSMLRVEKFCG